MTAKAFFQSPIRKPNVGMTVTFKESAGDVFAGVPAQVTYVWPRFRSGDYLVTIEFEKPVRTKEGSIAHIDAFMSELEFRG